MHPERTDVRLSRARVERDAKDGTCQLSVHVQNLDCETPGAGMRGLTSTSAEHTRVRLCEDETGLICYEVERVASKDARELELKLPREVSPGVYWVRFQGLSGPWRVARRLEVTR